MTDASYRQAQTLMRQLNHLRGLITQAKESVGKWTRMEMSYRENLENEKADGAKKALLAAMHKLDRLRDIYAAIQFPAHDLPNEQLGEKFCRICQTQIESTREYCVTCETNQKLPKYDFKNRNDKAISE